MKPVLRNHAFTLIEAVFSVGIASVLLIGIYSFFGDSIRKVGSSDETLATVSELQSFVTQLREDLMRVTVFNKGGQSDTVDGYMSLPTYERPPRYFTVNVWDDVGITTLKDLRHLEIVPKLLVENGVKTWVLEYKWDSWFDNKIIHNSGPKFYAFCRAFAGIRREIKEPIAAEVLEYYLAVDGEKVWYRHYIKDNQGKPLNYVVRYIQGERPEDEIETHRFGQLFGADGRVEALDIEPIIEFSYFRHAEQPDIFVLQMNKMLFRVAMGLKGEQQGTGPEGRSLELRFHLMNATFNGERFSHGLHFAP